MSYFAFGVIESNTETGLRTAYPGCDVSWGKARQQSAVTEMLSLHGKPSSSNENVFSLSRPGDDTADRLISPFVVPAEAVIEELRRMLAWLDHERGGRKAELWLTEGYDDKFREVVGPLAKVQEIVRTTVAEEPEIPSLRIILANGGRKVKA